MIAIKEFITRLEQGYSEAFLCRGEDGHLYVVKSRLSGKESLIREWLCACVAREFGLPVPDFDLVYADRVLADYSGNEQLAALADTPGFGSRFVTQQAAHGAALPLLSVSDVPNVPPGLRRRVLLFDLWVLNFDRTDENPNLLWDPLSRSLHVIDHNLAFDTDPIESFWSRHIFRAEGRELSDPSFRASESAAIERILGQVGQFWAEMPEDWTEVSDLTAGDVDRVLRRCRADDFWIPR